MTWMVQATEGDAPRGPFSTVAVAQQVVAGQLTAEARVRPAHARHGVQWTPVDEHPPIGEAVIRLGQQAEIAESQEAERGGADEARDPSPDQEKRAASAYVLFGALFLAPPSMAVVWLHAETNLSWPAIAGCLVVLEIAIALWVWFDFPGL